MKYTRLTIKLSLYELIYELDQAIAEIYVRKLSSCGEKKLEKCILECRTHDLYNTSACFHFYFFVFFWYSCILRTPKLPVGLIHCSSVGRALYAYQERS